MPVSTTATVTPEPSGDWAVSPSVWRAVETGPLAVVLRRLAAHVHRLVGGDGATGEVRALGQVGRRRRGSGGGSR